MWEMITAYLNKMDFDHAKQEKRTTKTCTLSSLYLAARSNPIGYGEKREA